jgi:hypothetical protein
MPSFLNVVRTADVNFREFLFQQLAVLIAIVKQHIRNYLDDIFTLIKVGLFFYIRRLLFVFSLARWYDTDWMNDE